MLRVTRPCVQGLRRGWSEHKRLWGQLCGDGRAAAEYSKSEGVAATVWVLEGKTEDVPARNPNRTPFASSGPRGCGGGSVWPIRFFGADGQGPRDIGSTSPRLSLWSGGSGPGVARWAHRQEARCSASARGC